MSTKEDNKKRHVVIVGGGMAGLMAARELLSTSNNNNTRVTLVEASDYFGGRIRGNTTFIPNHVVELGAEYIHGKKTLLTTLVEELSEKHGDAWPSRPSVTHEAFITAFADGGPHPSCGATEDGFYGRYYMNEELLEGSDERLQPLHIALATMDNDADEHDVNTSIGQVLQKRLPLDNEENKSLHGLIIAGYANTVGCTNLEHVSLHMLQKFEDHWQEHEEEGDLHMDSRIGMYGIIEAFVRELETNELFEAKLNWQVVDIRQQENGVVKIVSQTGHQLEGDAVIVTVPPPMLTKLGLSLNDKKLEALQYIGFDSAIKFILKLSSRLWPAKLESVICADCLVPEMWFHDYVSEDNGGNCYTVTCFLTSDCARNFLKLISEASGKPSMEKAARLVMEQLSTMFDVSVDTVQNAYLDSLFLDWTDHPFIQGGYMYPKVGLTRQHLENLAEPSGNIFFAGEATNTNACCTIQAAMETGVRAAKQVQTYLYHNN